jgi:RHS repeat-associated protein
MGRVLSQTEQIGTTSYPITYTYNLAGELTSETYPTGSHQVQNYYDEAGRLSSVKDGLNVPYENGLTYDASGGLTSETFGNSAVQARTFNNRLQTSQIKLTLSGTVQQQYDYSYGTFNTSTGVVDATKNNSQIGSITSTIAGSTQWKQGFSYDSIGRLSNVAEYKQASMSQVTYQQGYTYDRFGNRFQSANATLGLIGVSSGDIDATTNRFTSGAATYDGGGSGAGNITSDLRFRGLNYVYDANGRQTQAYSRTDNNDSSVSVYDGNGQRVQTKIYGYTRQMVYDAFGQLIAEYGGGTLEREYIYRGGQLLAISEATGSQVNLSQGKTATQSSTFVNGGSTFSASLAVDGSTDGAFWDLHSSATNFESQPWWQVDLGIDTQLDTVEVWPRTDCCPDHTANFYVLVSDQPFSSNILSTALNQAGVSAYYVNGYANTPTVVSVNRTGRYVRVWRSDSDYLVLAEVQVWGPGSGQALKYVMGDEKGSTRMVMQGTSVVSRHDYLPFGEEIFANIGLRSVSQGYGASDRVRPLYAGMERDDANGLDHTLWRKYESMSGRWTSPDPYKGSMDTSDPQSFNRYSYVQNDPANFTDRLGLDDDPLAQGIAAARSALENPTCRALFLAKKIDPIKMLERYADPKNKLLSVGPLTPGGKPFEEGVVAMTGARGIIVINQDSPFVLGYFLDFEDKQRPFMNLNGFRGLTLAEARGAVVIHELMHAAKAIPSEHGDQKKSELNSVMVQILCFTIPSRPLTSSDEPLNGSIRPHPTIGFDSGDFSNEFRWLDLMFGHPNPEPGPYPGTGDGGTPILRIRTE